MVSDYHNSQLMLLCIIKVWDAQARRSLLSLITALTHHPWWWVYLWPCPWAESRWPRSCNNWRTRDSIQDSINAQLWLLATAQQVNTQQSRLNHCNNGTHNKHVNHRSLWLQWCDVARDFCKGDDNGCIHTDSSYLTVDSVLLNHCHP